MEGLLLSLPGALLVFLMRICDVSIGTIRVIYMIRGQRLTAATLGLLESGIFIFAVSKVLTGASDPVKMVGYAMGFATGTLVGMTVERWIASGSILVRLITRDQSAQLLTTLREKGFGVTAVEGQGRDGAVCVLFVVAPRKRGNELLRSIKEIDADAFITVDPVHTAIGGFVPSMAVLPTSVRK